MWLIWYECGTSNARVEGLIPVFPGPYENLLVAWVVRLRGPNKTSLGTPEQIEPD